VPDDVDYIWLDAFIGDAPNWSTEDVATARSLLADQRRAVAEAHPRDTKTRERLGRVVSSLERAIEKHTG
jgi:hypothetical protein